MGFVNRLHILVILLLGSLQGYSQQEVMVSQYMFNGLFLNPAYAGSHPYVSGSLLHREQWTGMPGAPSTSMAAFDAPLWTDRMGLGLSVVHDQIGISRELDIAGHYSYSIRTGDRAKLAFGLRAGLSMYSARIGDLVHWDANDPLYQQDIRNLPVARFGYGMYWHDDLSYLGVSIPTIYAVDDKVSEASRSEVKEYFKRHLYINAGRVFHISEDVDVKPSVLIKYQEQAPPEADINCNLLYRERIWIGAGYRTGDAVIAILEYQATQLLRVGYAYDMNTSRLNPYNGGSHEIMLGMDFGKDPIRIKTPRYF